MWCDVENSSTIAKAAITPRILLCFVLLLPELVLAPVVPPCPAATPPPPPLLVAAEFDWSLAMPNPPAAAPGSSGLTSTMLVIVGVAGSTITRPVAVGLAKSPSSMVVTGGIGAGVLPLTRVVVMILVPGVFGASVFVTVLTTRMFGDGVTEGTRVTEGTGVVEGTGATEGTGVTEGTRVTEGARVLDG